VALHTLVNERNVSEAKGKHDMVVELDQFLNCHEDSLQGVLNDILAHLAASGNGNGVSINHAETLLEDGFLGFGRCNFFFA